MSRRNEHFYNATRNCYRNSAQVLPTIGVSTEWIEQNVSYRELTLAEIIGKRNETAKTTEPLAPIELHHLLFAQPAAIRYRPWSVYGTLARQFANEADASVRSEP
jgi:hypothetical protein